jgi:hypothetical protein
MNLFHHLQRQAAFSRATFGPAVRTLGIIEHIKSELTEIKDAPSSGGRSKEWVDVALLAFDGLLRSCREELSTPKTGTANNAMIAERACRLFQDKQCENEMRIWPDYRTVSEDAAINHQTDLPRKFTGPVSGQVKAGDVPPVWGDISAALAARDAEPKKTEKAAIRKALESASENHNQIYRAIEAFGDALSPLQQGIKGRGLSATELIEGLHDLTIKHGDLPVSFSKIKRGEKPVRAVFAIDQKGNRIDPLAANFMGLNEPATLFEIT